MELVPSEEGEYGVSIWLWAKLHISFKCIHAAL